MTGVPRLLARSALPWLVVCATACGPVTYVSRVTFNALGDMAEMRASNAKEMAPYEYTAATEYLRRSQELAGYARFQDSNGFAKKCRENLANGKKVAARRTRNNELAIYDPNDKTQFLTKDGGVKRGGRDDEKVPGLDNEKPPGLDSEKPPMTPADDKKGAP